MIDEVINRFDFPRVRTAVQSLGWAYGGETEAPSIKRLQAKARALLEEVVPTFVLASGHATKGRLSCCRNWRQRGKMRRLSRSQP